MKTKQLIAMLMTVILIVGMLPFNAFAEDAVLSETPIVSQASRGRKRKQSRK